MQTSAKPILLTMIVRALIAVLVGSVIGCRSASRVTHAAALPSQQFAEVSIILEQNYTDQDSEIVIFAKGGDEGLVTLTVTGPDGREIARLTASDTALGVREFSMESPEPGLREVLGAYPEGTYTFRGVSVSGVVLESVATLSHGLLDPPQLTVDTSEGFIRWQPIAGAAGYVIEYEREADGRDEAKVTAALPATATSLKIPPAMLLPGQYQAGVAAVSEGGNIIVVELEFSIED